MKRKLVSTVLVVSGLIAVMAGCSTSANKGLTTITATDNGWDSQKIHNAIAEVIVENAYEGYDFQLSTASSNMNWQSIIAGEVDLDIESWTDNVASYTDDVAKGDIVEVGVLVPDSRQGVYVPRYIVEGDSARGIEATAPDLKTVEDLKKYASVFPDDENKSKGRLYGSIPGWMADEILYKKYELYNLDENYTYTRLGSESALFASLVAAYNLGEPWVGYCYEPTWVTGKLDLILLEDAPFDNSTYLEGGCAFPAQQLKIVSNRKFQEKAPDIFGFLEKYQTGSVLISSALAYIDETKASYEDAAIYILKNNEELLEQWLPAENAELLKDYLAQQK